MHALVWLICILVSVIVVLLLKRLFWKSKLPSLEQKHVLITGGSSGIGKAVAIKAARLGAHVTVIARNIERLEKAKQEITNSCINPTAQKINYISLDLSTNFNAIDKAFQQCESEVGPIFMLVNCAGMAVCGKVEDSSVDDFSHMINLNYYGTVFPTKAVLKGMRERKEGHIVITGSQASLIGIFGFGAYCGSKYALRGFAEALYMEMKPHNVSVSLCLPPDTDTPGFENEEKTKPEETKLISETAGLAEPEEVAHQLLSDALAGRFMSTVGLEGTILTTLCAGMGPLSSFSEVFLQVILMSFLRFISIGYIINFHMIINDFNKRKGQSKKKEE